MPFAFAVPSQVRPLRVVKPTVVTLANSSGTSSSSSLLPTGVEPIRIITTKPTTATTAASSSSSLQTATTTIVLPVMNIRQQSQLVSALYSTKRIQYFMRSIPT